MVLKAFCATVLATGLLAGCGGGGGDGYSAGPLWLPTDVKLADIDGDGRLDVVTLMYSIAFPAPPEGRVNVWRQTAPGAFSGPETHAAGSQPWKLAIADIDGDDAPDLVISDVGGDRAGGVSGVWMLRQESTRRGTFKPAQRLVELPRQPYQLAIGDVNRDGAPDIVATGSQSGWSGATLLPQDPNQRGSFLPAVLIALPGVGTSNVALGDVDGDGRIDLVSRVDLSVQEGRATTVLGVRRGQPDGTLTPWAELPSPAQDLNSQLLAVVDANGDGRQDILEMLSPCCQGVAPQVFALFQAPDAGFARVASSLSGLKGMGGQVFADLDGDGRQDFAMAGSYPVPAGPLVPPDIEAQINILRQDAGGVFVLTQSSGLPFGSRVGAGDVNGDGLNDLVVFDDEGGRPMLQFLTQSLANRGVFVLGQTLR